MKIKTKLNEVTLQDFFMIILPLSILILGFLLSVEYCIKQKEEKKQKTQIETIKKQGAKNE